MSLLDERVEPASEEAALKAAAHLYHSFFTGLILHTNLKAGEEAVGNWTFRVFRRLHLEKFVSSFDKLGLTGEPDPVAAAKYHYLSNSVGGVEVEFMPESDRKAWVRFCHPRWLYDGTALCGVPESVSHGFLRGWYAHNGVSLGNDRMGFVCVSQDMTAEVGMAGYFYEYDDSITEEERLKFAPEEVPPRFVAAKAPKLDASDWPRARLLKANRNYAMDYVRVGLVELVNELGLKEAHAIASHAAALIGRQYYRALQKLMGFDRAAEDAESLAAFWLRLARACGDEVNYRGVAKGGCGAGALAIRQTGWRLMRGEDHLPEGMVRAWAYLFDGMRVVHNRFLPLEFGIGFDPERADEAIFEWRLG